MDKTVYPFIDSDKDAEVGDILDLTLYGGPHGIFFFNDIPRIRLNLFHAQRNPFFGNIDVQNYGIYHIADIQDLRWMSDLPGPGHFRHMNQSFHPLFHLDKRAVIRQTYNTPCNSHGNRVLFFGIAPWVRCQLFDTKGHPCLFLIKTQNLYFDLVSELVHF